MKPNASREVKCIEKCPKCMRDHERGEFQIWQEGDKRVAAAPDIECPCGLALRWVVPIFCITPSGYMLIPRRDDQVPRHWGTR